MRLADLVDLEWLLRDGAQGDEQLGSERNRKLATRAGRDVLGERSLSVLEARRLLAQDLPFRRELCRRFVEVRREREPGLPGHKIEHAHDVASWILVVIGLLFGSGAAKALLAYDGSTPVNVLYFAGVFFGLQILLLVFLLAFVVWHPRPAAGSRLPALLHRPLGWLVGRLLPRESRRTFADLQELRARHTLYADTERWLLFGLAQRFGVAFNVGALATCLFLVTVSDLVFSWSTTLDVDAGTVHGIVRALSAPWSLVWPDAAPSLPVVEASQWVRMRGEFVGQKPLAAAIPLAAEWWKFLVAGLVTYGLVPRTLALLFGRARVRRARARAQLDHRGFQRLYERMLPAVGWEGPAPDAVRGPAPDRRGGVETHAPPTTPGAPGAIVGWGRLGRQLDALADVVARRFSFDVQSAVAAGGAELRADREAVETLGREAAERTVVCFEAGQQPTKDVLGFVRALRRAIGPGRPIVLLLLVEADGGFTDAEPDEREGWRIATARLNDPHLWVESLEVPA